MLKINGDGLGLAKWGENGKPLVRGLKKSNSRVRVFAQYITGDFNNGKKVLGRHQSEASHNVAIRALQYAPCLVFIN